MSTSRETPCIHSAGKMRSLQVVHIITTGIQSAVRYSGFNSPWRGVTTAIPVSCILETAVPHSTVIWSSFTLVQILFLPASFVPFILSDTCGIHAVDLKVLVFYPDAPFILLQQRHLTSAVLTRVTQITPSRGHKWKRSAHVKYASSLSPSLPACYNYPEYWRILTKFGI